ncbi:3-isopropylmalate dehydrogenase [Algimonas porphyrae]|uniref:3-isopropylmalate dehydrogenase n=1 Tax=Algimonas porphyrae TaxID=1128113 RepID=A0ABQ5V0Q5_9PROT|nr:3-isopropylmalate dehydrogenase [Algimonas porphyrae]GLQ21135.1 3-isopropylmalate dehydrogenase [Algimonas porphyrae]
MNIQFTYLPGDGIGPEVGAAALFVLETVSDVFAHSLQIEAQLIGGAAIDAGEKPLPDATFESCQRTGAILLGAVGGPKWDHLTGADRPELGSLLPLRKRLNLYANIRPCKPYDGLLDRAPLKRDRLEGTDFVVMRELTGGIYFGAKGRDAGGAYDECRYSEAEVERIAIKAFDLAMQRRRKVTSVDKSNVLETSRLWRETVEQVSRRYPEVTLEHLLVDAMTMHMLTRPTDFDVVLTENMFGDILTDEASVLCGSMGVIPSASLSDGTIGLFEPIHGSAPDIAGQGKANPIAMILSAAWMLRLSFGLEAEASAIEAAVAGALDASEVTGDLGGALTTAEVGRAVAQRVRNAA